MNCIDLYSGIGGWTLGMHLAGVRPVCSYEWNYDSNLTHNLNFGTDTSEVNIRELSLAELPAPGAVDVVVGSPPCTQFSFANRGGGGNLEDGLVDLHKFFSIIKHLQPKFWAMENVPRVSGIIEQLLSTHPDFIGFKSLVSVNIVVDSSDYGTPQRRKRMICGDFPLENLLKLSGRFRPLALGDVINCLKGDLKRDPIYGWPVKKITDQELELPLNDEELRLNREAKRNHPIYNKMPFPEPLERPSRTVTSLCTRVSRESMVVDDDGTYRRLTLRERAMCMGFPVSFAFYGRNYSSKLKMIGNAIPPPLTFCIFSAMKGEIPDSLSGSSNYVHELPIQPPPVTPPPFPKNKFPKNRSFRQCIPNLRFGSGVRFELSNKNLDWKVRFFCGSSKSFAEVHLDRELGSQAADILGIQYPIKLPANVYVDAKELQAGWIRQSVTSVFAVLDALGRVALKYLQRLENTDVQTEDLERIFAVPLNRSLSSDPVRVLVGAVIGASFNNRHLVSNAEQVPVDGKDRVAIVTDKAQQIVAAEF